MVGAVLVAAGVVSPRGRGAHQTTYNSKPFFHGGWLRPNRSRAVAAPCLDE
jgi:hypothetical protein